MFLLLESFLITLSLIRSKIIGLEIYSLYFLFCNTNCVFIVSLSYYISLDSRFQFIPQMIFLNSLFGYLSVLIIVKWCTGSEADLYHVMIYMFLSPTDELGDNQLFPGQKILQVESFEMEKKC